MLATWRSDSDNTSESANDSDDLCLMAREDSTKDPETLIEVTIDNIINGPKEVLKDILLNLLKNELNSALEIKSLKNIVFESQTREESLLKEFNDLYSSKLDLESPFEKLKSFFDFKVKAVKN